MSPFHLRLAAVATFGVAGACAHAQSAQSPSTLAPVAGTTALADVVVTAARTPQRVDAALAEVTVIDRTALDRTAGRTLVEVLSGQPGLQFASTGGRGTNSALFIRGLESRHTLLLVDGLRVGTATVGAPSLDNLPLEAIERIEIVRGPMSALYGSDAVGGVIQIFTRAGRAGFVPNAKVVAGTHRTGEVSGGLAFGQGAFTGAVQVQHARTDGFSATNARVPFGSFNPDDDGFEQTGGSLRLGYGFAPRWKIDAFVLESHGEVEFDDGPGGDARAKLRNRLHSLQVSGRVLADWHTKLSVGRSIDIYDTIASASPFAALGEVETEQMQYAWENSVATPIGTAVVLLERLEQDVRRPGQPFTVGDRSIDAAALGLDGSAGAHTWQASVRHDRNSQFGDQTTGAAGYAYAFTPAWRAGASAGTSFVAPSFNQLYFPGFGNPLLQPEEGEHGEVHLRYTEGAHSVRLAWFQHRIDGYIPTGPRPVNVPRTRIDGATLAYEGRVAQLTLAASLDVVDPRNDTAGTANFDRRLPRRAKRAARLRADWERGAYDFGATLSAFSDRFDDAANQVRLAGYGTVDLRADWHFARDWTLGARINNATDKTYETSFGYGQPGREVYVMLRYAPQ